MTEEKKIGRFPFVLGGISFIPLIGVPFGIIVAIWGMVKWNSGGKKLTFIGLGGIAFTIVLYGALFYFGFVQRGGVYDDLRAEMSKTNLTSLVQAIEFYKVQNGTYPKDLQTLKESLPENSLVFVFDSSKVTGMNQDQLPYYYYELTENGQKYYLLSTGPDNIPFTVDDIVPTVNGGNIGLVINKKSKAAI
jgi:hypothetical protein